MSALVLTDVDMTIDAVDLGSRTTQLVLRKWVEPRTFMPIKGGQQLAATSKKWEVQLTFVIDHEAASTIATLDGALGTSVAFTGKPTSAATSPTNPEYSGNILVTEVHPIAGEGDALGTFSVTFPGEGQEPTKAEA